MRPNLTLPVLLAMVVAAACGSPSPAASPPTTQPAQAAVPTTAPAIAAPATAAGGPTVAAAASGGASGVPKIAPNANDSLKGKEIKIGVLTSTEGIAQAPQAKRQDQAIQIAVDELNAAGGVNGATITVVSADSHGNSGTIADNVRRLTSDEKVHVIIGPLSSGEGQIAYPAAAAEKTPIVCNGCAAAGILDLGQPYAFRLAMQDDQNTGPVIEYAQKTKGFKSVAIVYDAKDVTSKFMSTSFWPVVMKKLGVNVLTDSDPITFNSNDVSFIAQVTKLKAMNPGAVVLSGGVADVIKIAAEMQRQGIKTQLLGSGALQSSGDDFTKPCADACEGMITAAQFNPTTTDPEAAAIIKNFTAKCSCPATLNGAFAYDAVYSVVDVMRRLNVSTDALAERQKITDALHQLTFKGASGSYTFTANGDIVRPGLVATVHNGTFDIQAIPN
jgi:branched-chain amino acid transport system substrate-binding protein